MYSINSATEPPRNAKPARCEMCAKGVGPLGGFVTDTHDGWTEVMCPMCFWENYPCQAKRFLTEHELRFAKADLAAKHKELEPYK